MYTVTSPSTTTSSAQKSKPKKVKASELLKSPVFQDKTKPNTMVYCYCDSKGLVCTCIIG